MAESTPSLVLPLRTWLSFSHLAAFLLPVVVLVGSGALASDLRAQTRWDLEHQAALLSMLAQSELRNARMVDSDASWEQVGGQLQDQLVEAKHATLSGVRLTNADGVVIASSGSGVGADLSEDREVAAALKGNAAAAVRPRPAPSSPQPLSSRSRRAAVRVFLAAPIHGDGGVVGAVVLSRTPREELQALYQMAPQGLLIGALLALGVVLLIALAAAQILTRNLSTLNQGANAIAGGDFAGLPDLAAPAVSHVAEVAGLSRSVTAMAQRLEDRLAYISEFASNVAHEFKTPLATLKGTVELITDDEEMSVEQRLKFLGNASGELDRLERLVNGLLTLARADEQGEVSAVDLHALLVGVAARFDVAAPEGAGSVRGNASQLSSVFSNLLENAKRYGGENVSLTMKREGGEVVVTVTDDGAGISQANAARVFDRFFTTHRAAGGTGLGLALVRAVVEKHGGRVSVVSKPGRTSFAVRLPEAA